MFFSKLPKKIPNFWAAFARKIVTENFQKAPNLVTLSVTIMAVVVVGSGKKYNELSEQRQ